MDTPMLFTIEEHKMSYGLGKTPLDVRIERYALSHIDADYIPIHPKEYLELMDSPKGAAFLRNQEELHGLPIVPLGYRP